MSPTAIRRRYFAELAAACALPRTAARRFVLLSGGLDSFTLLAAVRRTYPACDVTGVLMTGLATHAGDAPRARHAATAFGIALHERAIFLNEIVAHLDLARGTTDRSPFQVLYRICVELTLRDLPLHAAAVYQGDGADSLYGNSSSFVYLTTAARAQAEGITKDEARERLKREHRAKVMRGESSGTASLTAAIIRAHGATPVQPFASGAYEYVLDVPLREFGGPKKRWVRDGLVAEWGIDPAAVAACQRITMQDGLGYYRHFCDELCRITATRSPHAAVLALTTGVHA